MHLISAEILGLEHVTLYTDECTDDQQSIQDNNIAAAKFNNGSHVLQFRFNCSQINTISQNPKAAPIYDHHHVKFEEESPVDALKVY